MLHCLWSWLHQNHPSLDVSKTKQQCSIIQQPYYHMEQYLICQFLTLWDCWSVRWREVGLSLSSFPSACKKHYSLKKEASEYLRMCVSYVCEEEGERGEGEKASVLRKHYCVNQPLLSQELLSRLRMYGICEEESLVNHSPTVSPDPSPESCSMDDVNSSGLNSCEQRQNKSPLTAGHLLNSWKMKLTMISTSLATREMMLNNFLTISFNSGDSALLRP